MNTGLGFSNVTPTAEGLAIGITDTNLDICCWHDEYPTFPGFLNVLAINDSTGTPCALGGFNVVINDGIALTPIFAQNSIHSNHTVTANVADGMGSAIPGVLVNFEITAGPHMGMTGTGTTNASGDTTFTYTGTTLGTDTLTASFQDSTGMTRFSNNAESEWIAGACLLIDFETEDDDVTPLLNGQDISTSEEFGVYISADGIGLSGYGAAIFDSDPTGPNSGASDDDLLVDTGNILILQESGLQTTPGIYDEPDDDALGGILSIDFLQATQLCSVNLIDVDFDGSTDQSARVTLVDSSNRERTYSVPSGWTEDIAVDGTPGYRTLDLRTLMPQAGFGATATATQDAGFDSENVRIMFVEMQGSAGIDDLRFIPMAPAQGPIRGDSKHIGGQGNAPGF